MSSSRPRRRSRRCRTTSWAASGCPTCCSACPAPPARSAGRGRTWAPTTPRSTDPSVWTRRNSPACARTGRSEGRGMSDQTGSAISGVSDYVPPKGEHVEYWWLQAHLARQAIADAGLHRKDIDGVVFTRSGYWQSKPVFPSTFCEHLGISPAWMELAPHGGAAMASAIWRASGAIRSGLANVVLVMSADNRQTRLQRSGVVSRIADQNMDPEFESPHGPLFASNFALMAHRYMHEYSVKHEAFAEVAVSNRRWASLHPAARMRTPLTVEDVLSSRP